MPRQIPIDVRRQVLMEAGYRCGVPTCRNILALDLHHIVHVAEHGGDAVDNLIALCGFCHDLYHKGEITRDAIRYWKGILGALNHAFDHETIDNLLFLHKIHNSSLLEVSADGVLKFSRLIAAGLATFSLMVGTTWLDFEHRGLSPPDDLPPSDRVYRLRLTRKGLMLVDAWLKGDRTELQDALSQAG